MAYNKYTKTEPIKNLDGTYHFPDFPGFRPNLSPLEILKQGAFGGTYFRKIKSGVTGKKYSNRYKLIFTKEELNDNGIVPDLHLTLDFDTQYNHKVNKYKVRKCGSTKEYWEKKGWISKYDPYGWFEWYCHFFNGRRLKSFQKEDEIDEDKRQVDRWIKFTGPKGRFKLNLINKIKAKDASYDDYSVSPIIRQSLLNWGYELTENDFK